MGTKRIPITFNDEQVSELDRLVGILGTTRTEVAKFMIVDWMHSNKKKELR